MDPKQPPPRLVLIAAFLILPLLADAGTFSCDFDSTLPPGAKLFGDATIIRTGGVNDSAALRLTPAVMNKVGSLVINPLDGQNTVESFTATFKVLIGGGDNADGFCFCFGPLPNGAFGERGTMGAGYRSTPDFSGLLISFDTFANRQQVVPGIMVISNQVEIASKSVPNLRQEKFVDVTIQFNADGTLDLNYDGEMIFTKLPVGMTNTFGRFGFGARTGIQTDNHIIDDLQIVTKPGPVWVEKAPAESTQVPETFFTDFNSGIPAEGRLFEDARVETSGGVDGSGVLKLVPAQRDQIGTFIVDPLHGARIAGFTATFKAYIGGGTAADGFAFSFAPDLPNTGFGETGGGSGLVVSFDTYREKKETTRDVSVIFKGNTVAGEYFSGLRTDHFNDVLIRLAPDGLLNVTYDGFNIFSNVFVGTVNTSGRFAWSARTGARTDNHLIDDLQITFDTPKPEVIETFGPLGDNVSPDAAVQITFGDVRRLNAQSIRMKLDGTNVKPELSWAGIKGLLEYQPPHLLEPGSVHTVQIAFIEQPSQRTVSFSYSFSISSNIGITK